MEKIDEEQIIERYEQERPNLDKLEGFVEILLKDGLDESDVAVHNIESRIKDEESIIQKARVNEVQRPIDDFDDLVGFRVICRFLSEIELIGNLIEDAFEVIDEDNKIEGLEDHAFGYMSLHYVCKLGDAYDGTPYYEDILDRSFEIQIRTISMDAWASISHTLDYKSEQDIPQDLRKDFYGISGLFYVADKHFQMFYREREEESQTLRSALELGEQVLAHNGVNLESLKAYLEHTFPARKKAHPNAVSRLVDELSEAGYETLAEIDEDLQNSLEALRIYEEQEGPFGISPVEVEDEGFPTPPVMEPPQLNRVGALRIALSIKNEDYRNARQYSSGEYEDYEQYLHD